MGDSTNFGVQSLTNSL